MERLRKHFPASANTADYELPINVHLLTFEPWLSTDAAQVRFRMLYLGI
jgi:hypothetical protein